MGRILSIDLGHIRTGLALSDPLRIISSPYETKQVKGLNNKQIIAIIIEEIKKNEVDLIVLGYPLGLSGQKTQKTLEVEKFKKELEISVNIKVDLYDESFSSSRAHKIMHSMGKKTGQNKAMVDSIAASIILDDYMKANL